MDDPIGFFVRLGLYLVLMLLFGLPAFVLVGLRGDDRRSGVVIPLFGIVGGLAVAASLLSTLQMVTLTASMSGVPLAAIDQATVVAVLSVGSMATAWKVRLAALALMLVVLPFLRRHPLPALTISSMAGVTALGTLAWFGHGAMDEGAIGWLHLGADLLHLTAAGLWAGALAAFLILILKRAAKFDRAHLLLCERALTGFAMTGTVVVAVLILTGLINLWLIVGLANVSAIPATVYGRLLIAKLVLFAGMLLFAAANRFRFTPALAEEISSDDAPTEAVGHLRWSLIAETVCLVAIFVSVAWLGMLSPAGLV